MDRKILAITIINIIILFTAALAAINHYMSKKAQATQALNNANGILQQYSGKAEAFKQGQIVFSFGCTAKKLLQQSTVKLPYSLDLDSNIITVSQFVDMPSKFELRDKKLGFTVDEASWGHFKFKGDTQEFIELSLRTTPSAVKMQEGVQTIKSLIQKLEAVGWKPASDFEKNLVQLDDQSIERQILLDQKGNQTEKSPGVGIMAWQSKEYRVDLHASVMPEQDLNNKHDLKMNVELSIKKL